MRTVEIKFLPKDHVLVDGDKDLVTIVTTAQIKPDSAPLYCVEWFDAGTAKELWVHEFRLSLAMED